MPNGTQDYDVEAAIQHLTSQAQSQSQGQCARSVREAVEAGGVRLGRTPSAKDYGPMLRQAGFQVVFASTTPMPGDVVVIQGFGQQSTAAGEVSHNHYHGHMAMYDGLRWVSDFVQRPHTKPGYPGNEYDLAQPPYLIYRHPLQCTAQ